MLYFRDFDDFLFDLCNSLFFLCTHLSDFLVLLTEQQFVILLLFFGCLNGYFKLMSQIFDFRFTLLDNPLFLADV